MSNFRRYQALLWPIVGGVVMVVLQGIESAKVDGRIDGPDWVTVAIQAFSLIIIWATANVPGFEKAKPYVSAVMLVLNLLVSMIVGGLDGNEITQLVVAFLSTVGVFANPGPVKTVEAHVVSPGRTEI